MAAHPGKDALEHELHQEAIFLMRYDQLVGELEGALGVRGSTLSTLVTCALKDGQIRRWLGLDRLYASPFAKPSSNMHGKDVLRSPHLHARRKVIKRDAVRTLDKRGRL